MKVLLVYPEFPKTYWGFQDALAFQGKRAAFPPLGLMTVAALLPQEWEKRLVDMNTRPLTESDVQWPDIVMLSAMLIQKEAVASLVKRFKAAGKKVVLGGPYITTSVNDLPDVDHIFVGEAETTLPEFVADLARGEAKRIYQATERPSLAISPPPDLSLVDMRNYTAMSVQYSRGCPFQCEFCDIIEIYGRRPRTKTNQQVLAELDNLFKAGWRGLVFIVDDNFIGNKPNVKKLLPDLASWQKEYGFPFIFITEASVNLADDEELLILMRDAGFRRVFLGIETPEAESLIHTKKLQNTRGSLLESVLKIQRHGMEVMAGFIVGFDTDKPEIFDRQIEFIEQSAIPLSMVGLLTALPDTALSRRLGLEGRLLHEGHGTNHMGLNFIPKMDEKVLISGYKRILREIYHPANYFGRVLKLMGILPASAWKDPSNTTVLQDLRTVLKIFWTLGVKNQHRRHFRKFLAEVFRKRYSFVQAMRFAGMWYHFHLLSEAQQNS